MKRPVRLRVKMERSRSFSTTVPEFCRGNSDFPYLCRQARRLKPGQSFVGGGGAAPFFRVARPR